MNTLEAINRKRREDGKASVEDFEKAGFAHKAFEHECPLPYGGYKVPSVRERHPRDGLLACGEICAERRLHWSCMDEWWSDADCPVW